MRTCDSFWMSFGVVPEAMSEWKPESAPQATVMNTNGKRGPTGDTGPPDGEKANSVRRGFCIAGRVRAIPAARRTMVPIFMNLER
jgi:hypothetical protein